MIKYYIDHLFKLKSKIILLFYVLILCLLIILFLPIGVSKNEVYFNISYYIETFNSGFIEILRIVILFITIFLLYESDKKYINNMTTYLSRESVIVMKIFSYISIVMLNYIIILLLLFFITLIFNQTFVLSNILLNNIFYLLMDNLMIILLGILVIRKENKILSLIIPLIYLLIHILYQNNNIIQLYYLLPFHTDKFLEYENAFYYKWTYLLLLVVTNIIRYKKQDFK